MPLTSEINRDLSPIRVDTDRKITQRKKPIFIALVVLGVIGVGVACVGITAFGGLTNLNQVNAMIMMSIGGCGGIVFLTTSIIGVVKYRTQHSFQLQGAHSAIDASYDHEDDTGILDLVYCNAKLGFGCVVDGTGHNNPRMQAALKAHFDPFIEGYTNELVNIHTYEALLHYFERKIQEIEDQFQNQHLQVNQQKVRPVDKRLPSEAEQDISIGTFLDPTYKPAMSFVQLMQLKDQLLLLTAQAGDTMVVVEMLDGELRKTQSSSLSGVGDSVQRVTIQSFDITGATRVIGFSDGIGEFLTFEELKEVTAATESRHLFNQLKEKAISQRIVDPITHAANGAYLKSYEKDNERRVDDMSLFVLDI